MALYAIGDIQGCYDELRALLKLIRFDPATDTVWFTGDLVNRGPRSADTLRYVRSLGPSAITVLGNHDLHLLTVAAGHADARKSDTLSDVIDAPDADELLTWLRQQPLAHHDDSRGLLLVHAGVHPHWSTAQTLQFAREVETVLRGSGADAFHASMYGNRPRRWREELDGVDRLRLIVNVLTRMRYLKEGARQALKFKGSPVDAPADLTPWFLAPDRRCDDTVIFGHWSSLGLIDDHGVISLDSGCLWGRAMTAVRLDTERREFFSIDCAHLVD